MAVEEAATVPNRYREVPLSCGL